jgi:hypothetical protein
MVNSDFFADHQIVQLRFVVREDADSLVVTANSETGGIVEIWELREKVMTVHKVLQKSSTPPPEFKTVVCFLTIP